MRYRLLGHTGLRVSELALGTMTFGADGWGASPEEATRILERYAEAGGNFIDTANRYGEGAAEAVVGDFVAADRDRFVVATKYTMPTDPASADPNAGGNHRKNLVHSVEGSLRRLRTEHIDVLWAHFWDPHTPLEELVRALDDLVRSGKVLYVGLSDSPAWVTARAQTLAEERGLSPFAGIQAEYSLVARTIEREHVPMARELDLAIVAWGAMGAGLLTGKYGSADPNAGRIGVRGMGRVLSEENLLTAAEVSAVAAELDVTAAQVALAWLRQQPGVVIPIVGASTADQMADNLGAAEVRLSPEQMARLDKVSAIEMGFPHQVVAAAAPVLTEAMRFGSSVLRLDDHRLGGGRGGT